jgi:hypothetical protein
MFLLLLSICRLEKKCKSISLKLNGLFSETHLQSICLAGNMFDRKSTPCAIQFAYMSSRIPLSQHAVVDAHFSCNSLLKKCREYKLILAEKQ